MIRNGIMDVHVECQGREMQFKVKEIASCSIKQQIEETMREMRNAENSLYHIELFLFLFSCHSPFTLQV